jgi:hypothetical protein
MSADEMVQKHAEALLWLLENHEEPLDACLSERFKHENDRMYAKDSFKHTLKALAKT